MEKKESTDRNWAGLRLIFFFFNQSNQVSVADLTLFLCFSLDATRYFFPSVEQPGAGFRILGEGRLQSSLLLLAPIGATELARRIPLLLLLLLHSRHSGLDFFRPLILQR